MSLGQNGASLQDLLRREPLGSEEWIRRLETRKERLVPHINSLPLTRLGDHPLIGYHRQLILQADVPIRSNDLSLSLETRGLFINVHLHRTGAEHVSPGTRMVFDSREGAAHVWGLSENADWLLMTVRFRCRSLPSGNCWEKPVQATISHRTPLQIAEATGATFQALCRDLTVRMWRLVDKNRRFLSLTQIICQE